MTNANETLKPCPFCGGKAELHNYDTPTRVSYVECSVCGARVDDDSDEGVAKRWNLRYERKRWKEYFCLSPMIESDNMINAETLGRICGALGAEFKLCYDDRGGIGFGRISNEVGAK